MPPSSWLRGVLIVWILATAPDARAEVPAVEHPRVGDPRLQISLFAATPEVVTPIGLAIGAGDRVYVLESHTHSPPRDYAGPRSDRIKVFVDSDGDGRANSHSVFAEGISDGMNIAFSPAGDLCVVTSTGVLVLHDRDGDQTSEARSRVLELITPEAPYEHAALLGIAFSQDGWMYISRGNVGSLRYTLKGTDGSMVSGFGDGGSIVRCRPDGSRLSQVATGFWNPFGLHIDAQGRLLCVDNDPDARGPNRLVHVIQGGDYGYKSMYGGGGNHPYQAWSGDLPGTLPFVAGLGEAPCAVIDARRAALPADYATSVLSTIWGQHEITRSKLKPQGVSMVAENEALVVGDQNFRPVAMTADSKGAIYFSDWVQRDYPNHGQGRIWRLTSKAGVPAMRPITPSAPATPGESERMLERLETTDDFDELKRAMIADDPFVRSAAVNTLSGDRFRERTIAAIGDSDARTRLGALLTLRRSPAEIPTDLLRRLLRDPDEPVRRMALITIGERAMEPLRGDINVALSVGEPSTIVFETYLATLECLTPRFASAFRNSAVRKANQLPRRLEPAVIEELAANNSAAPALRAIALTRLDISSADRVFSIVRELRSHPDAKLRLEAIRTLSASMHAQAPQTLLEIATDTARDSLHRAEGILGLSVQPADRSARLLPLLDDPSDAVRVEAARALRRAATVEGPIRAALAERLRTIPKSGAFFEQIQLAVDPAAVQRPASLEEWQRTLAEGGDPASGRRAFFSASVGCSQCHTIENRGGKLGPDLSRIAQSRDRAKLIHAILRPSDEYSIDYQAWFIKTRDREMHLGLQLDLKDRGDIELFTTEGKTVRFKGPDIVSYGALKQSLMPDGLEKGMTVSDMRDLVEFLSSRR